MCSASYSDPLVYHQTPGRATAARGLRDGDAARVWNDLGDVVCRARVDARIRRSVVAMPKGVLRVSDR